MEPKPSSITLTQRTVGIIATTVSSPESSLWLLWCPYSRT